VLAELRAESWQRHAWPSAFAGVFHRSGVAVSLVLIIVLTAALWSISTLPGGGEGFYAALGHGAMVSIFLPAFLFPVVALAIGLRGYWREISGSRVAWSDLAEAAQAAGALTNLSGGRGQGCNFEKAERYSQARRHAHQATLWGFGLCFAATCVATLMHYLLNWPAPYPWWAPPKLLGVPGGVLLVAGCASLAWLKTRADRALDAPALWGGEMAFVLLLGLTGLSGLVLYAATGTGAVAALLALHLASVFTLFVLTPYSKMVHGAYRLAALVRDAQQKRLAAASQEG